MKIKRAILDFSAICFAQFYGSVLRDDMLESDEEKIHFFKHCVLNKLADIQKTLRANETIIAVDSSSWRKDHFEFYKAARAIKRAEKPLETNLAYACINELVKDLSNLNYKVVQVDGAEADDIIGVLCSQFANCELTEIVYIVSGDKDFQQLTSDKIKLFDHKEMKVINCEDKDRFMVEMILRGDTADGIPNVLSDDDTFINSDKRQKQLRKTKIDEILSIGIDKYKNTDANFAKNYDRNKKLIVLSEEFIPENIWCKIKEEYDTINANYKKKNAIIIGNWFRCNNLNGLLEKVDYLI